MPSQVWMFWYLLRSCFAAAIVGYVTNRRMLTATSATSVIIA